MFLGFLLPCLDGKWTKKAAFGPRWALETRDADLGCPPIMPPRPGEVQTEDEGTLECVTEEGDEKYPFWP